MKKRSFPLDLCDYLDELDGESDENERKFILINTLL